MTLIDTGTYGAKRQSFKKASPRDLLQRLIAENTKASEEKLCTLHKNAMRDDPDFNELFDAVHEYWFANNYRSLLRRPEPLEHTVAERKQLAANVAELKKSIRVRAAQMVLLDIKMPNGRALRENTFKDCAKGSGWLAKLSKAGKPNERVGDVLSEAQVRKFWR